MKMHGGYQSEGFVDDSEKTRALTAADFGITVTPYEHKTGESGGPVPIIATAPSVYLYADSFVPSFFRYSFSVLIPLLSLNDV